MLYSSRTEQIVEYRSQIEAIDNTKLYYVAHRTKAVEHKKSLCRLIADLTGEVIQRQTALHVVDKDIQLSDKKIEEKRLSRVKINDALQRLLALDAVKTAAAPPAPASKSSVFRELGISAIATGIAPTEAAAAVQLEQVEITSSDDGTAIPSEKTESEATNGSSSDQSHASLKKGSSGMLPGRKINLETPMKGGGAKGPPAELKTLLISSFEKPNDYISDPRACLAWTTKNQAAVIESNRPALMIAQKLRSLLKKGTTRNNLKPEQTTGGIPDEHIKNLVMDLFVSRQTKWLRCADNNDALPFFQVHAQLLFAANMSNFTRGEIITKSTKKLEAGDTPTVTDQGGKRKRAA